MTNGLLCTYEDFEAYFMSFKNLFGIAAVVVGDIEESDKLIVDSPDEHFPLLHVNTPSFTSYRSGGNKNRFDSSFLVLQRKPDDAAQRREFRNQTREIALSIQKKMEEDSEAGMFEMKSEIDYEPKNNLLLSASIGWYADFEISTPGVGIESDYR